MVSKLLKKTLWGRVYYSTLPCIAVSLDAASSVVKIHVGKNAYMAGSGAKSFLRVIKILRKYEELGYSGIPPVLKQLIEEYN